MKRFTDSWRQWLAPLTAALVPWTLAACGGEAALLEPAPPTVAVEATLAGAPSPAPLSTAPAKPQPLVIYSGRSEALVGPIIRQFSEATGIEVKVKYGASSALAATLLEEGARSPADLYFAQDPGDLGAVRSLFQPLALDILNTVPQWARSAEGRWVGLSGRARVVVYNTEKVAEAELPESVAGFTDPRWTGRIGWAPANASFQAMVSAMRIVWGEEKALEWVRGIQANQPTVFPNNTSIVRAVAAGEIDAGFVNHYYLHQLIAQQGEGVKARNYFTPRGDAGSVVLVAGAGVLNSARHRDGAEKFLRFMLSAPAQQYFASQTHEFPLVSGVVKDRLLPDLEKIHKPDIDLSRLDDVKGTQDLLRQAGAIP